MVSDEIRTEIAESLGHVPSFIEVLAEPASDHSWGIMRDLEFGETKLTAREKALIGVATASAIQCKYCIHFHTEEAKLAEVTDDEVLEAVNLSAATRYFSTVLHGSQADYDGFVDETAEIVDHLQRQEMQAGAD